MAYADEVLADSPRIYLRLGETSGSTAEDSSGNNIDGTYEGPTLNAAGLIEGDADKAATFDGTDDRIIVMDSFDPTSYTVEAWFMFTDPNFLAFAPFCIADRTDSDPTNNYSHMIGVNATGRPFHYTYDGAIKRVDGSTLVVVNQAYHIAATFTQSGSIRVFLNGVEEGTAVAVGTPWAGGDRWFVGRYADSIIGQWFGGVIDEVAIYPTALSAARLLAHVESGQGIGGVDLWRSVRRLRNRRRARRSG